MSILDLFQMFKLDSQVVIVTGGGTSIGKAIAELFAEAGASVVVSDLKLETAQAVADSINTGNGSAIATACDVSNDDALQSLVNLTLDTFGQINILVNNVGGGGPKPFDMDMDTFIWAYKLNIFSVFHLCQLCVPHMEKSGGGAILNISSMAGDNKNINMASYSSSKAAVSHLTRNIAFDLGPKNIRVNAIAPGAIKTEAFATVLRVLNSDIEKKMLKRTPLGRLGKPNDIAYASLFLCSAAASWISGQVLTVSGGGVQELD